MILPKGAEVSFGFVFFGGNYPSVRHADSSPDKGSQEEMTIPPPLTRHLPLHKGGKGDGTSSGSAS